MLVYDLGGGTFDVTVVEYTPTHFRVLATDGDVELGGVRLEVSGWWITWPKSSSRGTASIPARRPPRCK